MTLYDLLFLVLVLGTLAVLATLIALVVRRKRKAAGRLAASALLVWCVYLLTGSAVALLTPQRIVAMGEDRCFDEMCFAATSVDRVPSIESNGEKIVANGVFYLVTVRASSRSRGRTQRESGLVATLVGGDGHIYNVSQIAMRALGVAGKNGTAGAGDGSAARLDSMLEPGQSAFVTLVFDVPASVHKPGLVLSHSYKLNPGSIIMGDDQHFLHRHAMVQLDR